IRFFVMVSDHDKKRLKVSQSIGTFGLLSAGSANTTGQGGKPLPALSFFLSDAKGKRSVQCSRYWTALQPIL
ncbi:MAG: hypothetical protein Q7U34_08365, partial [Anaerolineales bacterium]|nr:hypothetical protein [Anaerolineales bacterium]